MTSAIASTTTIYRYPAASYRNFALGVFAQLVVLVGFGVYSIQKQAHLHIDPNYTIAGWFFICFGCLGSYFGIVLMYLRAPVLIDESGIATLYASKIRRHIRWTEVTGIRWVRSSQNPMYRMPVQYHILASGRRIRIFEDISDLPMLVAELNKYVHRYNIPILLAGGLSSHTVELS
jgi:hypothetical protein